MPTMNIHGEHVPMSASDYDGAARMFAEQYGPDWKEIVAAVPAGEVKPQAPTKPAPRKRAPRGNPNGKDEE